MLWRMLARAPFNGTPPSAMACYCQGQGGLLNCALYFKGMAKQIQVLKASP
jgi:hypothetical protein